MLSLSENVLGKADSSQAYLNIVAGCRLHSLTGRDSRNSCRSFAGEGKKKVFSLLNKKCYFQTVHSLSDIDTGLELMAPT